MTDGNQREGRKYTVKLGGRKRKEKGRHDGEGRVTREKTARGGEGSFKETGLERGRQEKNRGVEADDNVHAAIRKEAARIQQDYEGQCWP